jgi:VanZ like family/Concanavalin A-like lectin/glucanases superfamily
MLNLKSRAAIALATALLGALAIILVAGLWPFNPLPANHVTWLKEGNGLEFGRDAILLSSSRLDFTGPNWSSISMEIWLQPSGNRGVTTFFSIYTPENPKQLRLMQYQNVLLLRRERKGGSEPIAIGVDKAFFPNTSLFATITSGPKGCSIYLNGKLAREFRGCFLTGRDLSGQLIIGTSPFEQRSWHGEWKGLAIYGAELSPADVLTHYEKWISGRQAEPAYESAPMALFDFHERAGDTIHELRGVAPNLMIPKHYSVPHKPMLQRPWDEFHPDRAYAADVALNIAGFVPLGFLLSTFLRYATRSKRPVLTAILIGALISLTIEVLQIYIPPRSSDMTDVITNTLGTALGAVASASEAVGDMLARFGLMRQK